MTIQYRYALEGIGPQHLQGFFVGWPNPPAPETHLRILAAADQVVLALASDSGQVVGFINAITDGTFMAFIPLLEVVADYQARGIGSELVRRLLDRLAGYYAVDAMCDPDLQPFYRHLGLVPATGVMLRNYDRQSAQP